ncbi:MAG: GIY-YIG nuclease family protein [Bdellovibrionota bacterium]
MKVEKAWYIYIIETKSHKYYTGITTDVQRRFQQHASKKGAKYFYMDPPQQIVWQVKCENQSEALREEARIKKLPVHEKQKLFTRN